MVDGGVNTEGQEVNPTNEVGQRQVELEAYLGDARVGTPKFMAFWDLLDLKSVEAESFKLLRGELLDPNKEASTRALYREQLLRKIMYIRRS